MALIDRSSRWTPRTDPVMEPALAVIRQHRDVAKTEIDRLESEIDARHAEMKRLKEDQDLAVKQLHDFQTEFRAHERLLSAVSGTPLH